MENQLTQPASWHCCSHGPAPASVSVRWLGIDETAGRYGDVSIWRCRVCFRRWLRYAVRYGQGPSGEIIYVALIPPKLHPMSASSSESVMNASPLIFAWIGESYHSNWTRLAGRVRLGIRR